MAQKVLRLGEERGGREAGGGRGEGGGVTQKRIKAYKELRGSNID